MHLTLVKVKSPIHYTDGSPTVDAGSTLQSFACTADGARAEALLAKDKENSLLVTDRHSTDHDPHSDDRGTPSAARHGQAARSYSGE